MRTRRSTSEHAHTFLWCFKYAPSTLTKFPEVSLDQTYAVLDDMERRWRAGGHSMHAVHQHRWLVANHIGDEATAAEQYRLWSTAPRDDLSDCIGCDPTAKVRHLIDDRTACRRGGAGGRRTGRAADLQRAAAADADRAAAGLCCRGHVLRSGRRASAGLPDAPQPARRAERRTPTTSVFCARTGNETRGGRADRAAPGRAGRPADARSPRWRSRRRRRCALSRVRPDDPAASGHGHRLERAGRPAGGAGAGAGGAVRRTERDRASERARSADPEAEPWVEYLPLSETARRAQPAAQAGRHLRPEEPLPWAPTGRQRLARPGRGGLAERPSRRGDRGLAGVRAGGARRASGRQLDRARRARRPRPGRLRRGRGGRSRPGARHWPCTPSWARRSAYCATAAGSAGCCASRAGRRGAGDR